MPRRPSSNLTLSLFAEREVLSVSELTDEIKASLEAEYFDLHVQGEISNYKRAPSGHAYFTLRDANAQVRATFFRQWNRLLRFEPENGLEVRVRGRLSVYEARGDYQLMVETMEPVGVGTLQLAFEQQVRRLAAEGLFDAERKRPLPALPRRIAVVTSPTGAVIRDILHVLGRRNPGIDVLLAPVRVQGSGAAAEIAAAIKLLNDLVKKRGETIDVIIVGRGGGSAEDLWAFNEEQVARAIFASEIPVISAVGHETDYTVADLVADLRAPTPSAAAEVVAVERSELRARVDDLLSNLGRAVDQYLLEQRSRLRDLTESRGFAETVGTVLKLSQRVRDLEARATLALQANLHRARLRLKSDESRLQGCDLKAPMKVAQARLDALNARLARVAQAGIERQRHRFMLNLGKLEMLSPLAVLSRGYAIVRNDAGRLVAQAATLKADDRLDVRFVDGEVECRVTQPLTPNQN